MAHAAPPATTGYVVETGRMFITSGQSIRRGVIWSVCVSLTVTTLLALFVTFVLDGNSLPARLCFFPLWFALGVAIFEIGRFHVDFQHRAAQRRLGRETGYVYMDGTQWANPFFFEDAMQTPGPDQQYSIRMPKSVPEAKDIAQVFVGFREAASIVVRVIDPVRFSAADDPVNLLINSFLNYLRFFVNRLEFGMAIFHEKSLLEDYIELEPLPPVDHHSYEEVKAKHDDVERRMRELTYDEEEGSPHGKEEPAIQEKAIEALMKKAGTMRREARGWGMDIDNIFTPSIDPAASVSRAANKKVASREERKAHRIMGDTMVEVSGKLKKGLTLTGPDAADRYERLAGRDVNREVKEVTFGLSGQLETAAAGAVAGIASAAAHKLAGPMPDAVPPAPPTPPTKTASKPSSKGAPKPKGGSRTRGRPPSKSSAKAKGTSK